MAEKNSDGRPVFVPMEEQKERMPLDVERIKAGMAEHAGRVEKGGAALQDAEYLIDRYYEQHVLPLVEKHLKEYAAGGMVPADVYMRVQKDLEQGAYAGDISVLMDCWRDAAVKAVGEERYMQASDRGALVSGDLKRELEQLRMLPREEQMKGQNASRIAYLSTILEYKNMSTDVASAYVGDRLQVRLIDDIADYMKPGNTVSYTYYKIKDESFLTNLPGLVKNMAVGGYNMFRKIASGGEYTPEQEDAERALAEYMIEKKSLERYSPNLLERWLSNRALEAVDFTTFAMMPGGKSGHGLLLNAVIEEGFFYYRVLSETVDDVDRQKMARGEYVYGKDPFEKYGNILFDSASADLWRIRHRSTVPATEDVVRWDSHLSHHVSLPKEYDGANRTLAQKQFGDDVKAIDEVVVDTYGYKGEDMQSKIEASLVPSVIAKGFSVDLSGEPPAWMAGKKDSELYTLSVRFSSYALAMMQRGQDTMVISGKTMNLGEVVQRSYDYATALRVSQERSLSLEGRRAKEEGGTRKEERGRTKDEGRGMAVDVPPSAREEGHGQRDMASLAHRAAFGLDVAQAPHRQGGAVQQETEKEREQRAASSGNGWESFKKLFGLHGAGSAWKNLPDVIAHLPDLLMGMFSGKSKNASLNDALLPLGCVMMGCFVKNPILRTLLFLFGGINLLSRFNKDRQEQTGVTPAKQYYRPYGEESLNSRITQPVVKDVNGGSVLVMKVDGKDYITTLPAAAADAYHRGVLPLSTLANHVLSVNGDAVEQEVAVSYQQSAGDAYEEVMERQLDQDGGQLKV